MVVAVFLVIRMKVKRLSELQKRWIFWTDFKERHVKDAHLKIKCEDLLKSYRNLIARAWEQHGDCTSKDISQLDSLERELECLNEQCRMTVAPPKTQDNHGHN